MLRFSGNDQAFLDNLERLGVELIVPYPRRNENPPTAYQFVFVDGKRFAHAQQLVDALPAALARLSECLQKRPKTITPQIDIGLDASSVQGVGSLQFSPQLLTLLGDLQLRLRTTLYSWPPEA